MLGLFLYFARYLYSRSRISLRHVRDWDRDSNKNTITVLSGGLAGVGMYELPAHFTTCSPPFFLTKFSAKLRKFYPISPGSHHIGYPDSNLPLPSHRLIWAKKIRISFGNSKKILLSPPVSLYAASV